MRLHIHDRLCYTLSIVPPSGVLRRRHRLRLTRHLLAPQDERTQGSIRELAERLSEIARATGDHADRTFPAEPATPASERHAPLDAL